MPVYDTTTVVGGIPQIISDWSLGDDRQFYGDVTLSPFPPPPGDLNLTDAYFTLKQSPIQTDAEAIFQIHITQSLTTQGQITANGSGDLSVLLMKIASETYQPYVQAGTTYFWDIRCITAGDVTFTIAIGTVAFLQGVTQTDAVGAPAFLPGQAQPQIRGFTSSSPQQNPPAGTSVFNTGDVYFNSNPTSLGPAGWICYSGGTPGAWTAFGTFSTTGWIPNPVWLQGAAAPIAGTYTKGQIVWNNNPTPGSPIGWVCTTGGTPGTWNAFGLISL